VPIASRPRQQPSGRYGAPAPAPAGGLGTAPSLNIRTAIGAVDDPLERGKKLAATVNRGVDVLEWELSHHQIDQAAYEAGRLLQRAYERMPTAANGSNWRGGDRIDPVTAQDGMSQRITDAGLAIRAIESRAETVIGQAGVAFLARILRDGWSFAELASRGAAKGSRADTKDVAKRFRWLLTALADGWAAKGRAR
jgi:hypothetical protein